VLKKGLPGTPLSEGELKRLPGLVRYEPFAKYSFSAGQAISKFLHELKNGRIVGRICRACKRVYVPPRVYCEYCHRSTDDWVFVSDEGIVHTAVVSYIAATRERMKEPVIVGVIRLNVPGYPADSYEFAGLFHKLCGVTEDDVKSGRVIGARVKARWKPANERSGSIMDIECFEAVREG